MRFITHIHPVKIPLKALELKSTWALGGMCLVLVFLLMGSGALMLFSYRPFPELAYLSVQGFETQFVFGQMIRSMHYFCANLIVLMVSAHMLRVFFTGGYQGKRRLNWLVGLCLLALVLLSCFTGYLLPWDQTAFWAITICMNMLDYLPLGSFIKGSLTTDNGIGGNTMQLFFTLHTTVIPSSLILFLCIHFWKVRKAKGVITSGVDAKNDPQKTVWVSTRSNLLLREAVVAVLLFAFVLVLATFFRAPLGEMANTGLSPNPAKAPWYFAGFQELLFHFHPFFAVFLIPCLFIMFLIFLPFMHKDTAQDGAWFISPNGKKAALTASIFSLIFTPLWIVFDEYFIDFQSWFGNLPSVISTGGIPFVFILIILGLFYWKMKKRYQLCKEEIFQTLAVFFIVSFVILTLNCTFFRGTGMTLGLGGF